GLTAVGAAEAVRATLVVRADPNRQVLRGELHVTAARAVRSNRRHRCIPSLVHPAHRTSLRCPYPSAGARRRLRGTGDRSCGTDLWPVARCVPVAVITFAHRGARIEEPENTIAAFRRALERGASGLETDVWLSSDGEVVCAHDPVVGR